MSETPLLGLSLIVLGGVLIGLFALPMKLAKRWPWEAIWLVYSITGLLVFPIAVGIATLPPLYDIYAHASTNALALTALFGFGWGVGAVLFGIGLSRLGMSLGYSIIMGLTAAFGSLVPILVLKPAEIATEKGILLLVGLAIILAGVYLCGVASERKAASGNAGAGSSPSGGRLGGLIICVLAGILAAMLNLAMAFGQDIAVQAVALGASASNAPNAIWVLAVACGAIANVGYCVFLLIRNGTGSVLLASDSLSHWFMGALMGAVWYWGITVYGRGATALGSWGAVLGWPVFVAMMILAANIAGWVTGEWRNTASRARSTMLAALAVLGLGVFVIGYSGAT